MATLVQEYSVKVENLCRTCLTKQIDLLSLFDVNIGNFSLDFVISATTGIKVEKDDCFPSTICHTCTEKATEAFEFRRKTQESDALLRNLIRNKETNETKTEIISNENEIHLDVKKEIMDCHDNDADVAIEFEDFHELDDVKFELPDQNFLPAKLESSVKDIKAEPNNGSGTYCPVCGVCYPDSESFTNHMWTKHTQLMGPRKRGRPKKMSTSLILHKLTENGIRMKVIKTLQCEFCKEQFKSKTDLQNHIFTHTEINVYYCNECRKMYLDQKYVRDHICGSNSKDAVMRKPNIPNYTAAMSLPELIYPASQKGKLTFIQVCQVCTGLYFFEEDYLKHVDQEHPEQSTRCTFCDKVFATTQSASRHRAICKQVERKHMCHTCGLKFPYEVTLNKHILKCHTGQDVSVNFIDTNKKIEEKQYQCDTCKKRFYRKELLVKHSKLHMPNIKCYECDVCKKKFSRKDNLVSHKRTHDPHRVKPSNCLCLYCGRSFISSSNLIVHMRRHTGEKPYKCDFCGKGFPRSSDLQCHRRSHTGEKPHVCAICGKAFARSNKLTRHMRVHTGIKPYKCSYCEKAFSQSNDLNLHTRRHTGDKPYICELCGDRFIQLYTAFARCHVLSRHMRVHTGVKPYKCNYCEKAFAQSNDLNLHIRRHTGDKPYICGSCGERFIQGTALQKHRRLCHFVTPSSSSVVVVEETTLAVKNITQ